MDLSVSRSIGIIPRHGKRQHVLVVRDADAWALPTYLHGGVTTLNDMVREQFGLDVTVTSCPTTSGDGIPPLWRLYTCEAHSDTAIPDGTRWVGESDVAGLAWRDPEHAVLLRDWFANENAGAGPAVPWERPGWFAEARAWAAARIEAGNGRITGPVQQVSCSLWSYVMRLPTSSGAVYFKASTAAFGHESALTAVLADWFPDDLARVLAVDPDRHWLLTAEVEQMTMLRPETAALGRYAKALVRYAEMQREAAQRMDELAGTGLPDRRPERMPELFAALLDEDSLLMVDQPGGVARSDVERLRSYLPRFRDRCEQLDEYRVPLTVVNTDLCYVNLGFTPRGAVFFDWAESSITSPLCSLRMFLLDIEDAFPGDPGVAASLRDAYLGVWVKEEPIARLVEAVRLVEPVNLVGRALTWRDCLDHVPPARRLEGSVAIPRNMQALLPFTQEG